MGFETLRYDVSDAGVATIALDQPDTRNALSDQLLEELIAAFERARDDAAVRCVVLTSTHDKVFSSGGNLAGFGFEGISDAGDRAAFMKGVLEHLGVLGG